MKIKLTLLLLLFGALLSAQNYLPGKYVNNQGETIVTAIKEPDGLPLIRTLDLQKEITIYDNGEERKLSPKDIASFSYTKKDKELTFDSIDGLIFGQRLYKGKAQLHKCLVQTNQGYGQIIRTYLLRKPNDATMYKMVAHGFSRLLDKDDMMPIFADCKSSQDKLQNDVIKIKDEDKLVAFIVDYESNCL